MRRSLLLAAVALSSCSAAVESETAPIPSTSSPVTTSTDAPEPTTTEADAAAPEDCAASLVDSVMATVDGQHLAIVERDFERALSFSSREFRAGVDPERFAMIIRSGYPFLLEANPREVRNCARLDGVVALIARFRVRSADSVDLAYRLVSEEGSWRIEAAGIIEESRIDV